jgi:hypothetical protein
MSKEKELKAKFFFCPKYGKAERCPMVKSASDLQQRLDVAEKGLREVGDLCSNCNGLDDAQAIAYGHGAVKKDGCDQCWIDRLEDKNSGLQQAHDKAVQALQILDPCEMCEHDFDGKEYSCPCYFKRTQDEALKEITK